VHSPVAIAQYLHLKMARVVEKALEIKRAAAERSRGLGLSSMKMMLERRRLLSA